MPLSVHGPRVQEADSTLQSYSTLSLWLHSVWLSSSSLMHLWSIPWVPPVWQTHPTVLSQLSQMKRNWLQPSPLSSISYSSPSIPLFSFSLWLPRWHFSGLRGRQADLCGAVCPLQTATQSSHCVEAILDTPVSYPRLVIPNTHSSQSRIVTIVLLFRAAWHQLEPVSTHTLGLLSPSFLTEERTGFWW